MWDPSGQPAYAITKLDTCRTQLHSPYGTHMSSPYGSHICMFAGPDFFFFKFLWCFLQFYLLLSPYLCFISFLYLDLFVLGDDARIS